MMQFKNFLVTIATVMVVANGAQAAATGAGGTRPEELAAAAHGPLKALTWTDLASRFAPKPDPTGNFAPDAQQEIVAASMLPWGAAAVTAPTTAPLEDLLKGWEAANAAHPESVHVPVRATASVGAHIKTWGRILQELFTHEQRVFLALAEVQGAGKSAAKGRAAPLVAFNVEAHTAFEAGEDAKEAKGGKLVAMVAQLDKLFPTAPEGATLLFPAGASVKDKFTTLYNVVLELLTHDAQAFAAYTAAVNKKETDAAAELARLKAGVDTSSPSVKPSAVPKDGDYRTAIGGASTDADLLDSAVNARMRREREAWDAEKRAMGVSALEQVAALKRAHGEALAALETRASATARENAALKLEHDKMQEALAAKAVALAAASSEVEKLREVIAAVSKEQTENASVRTGKMLAQAEAQDAKIKAAAAEAEARKLRGLLDAASRDRDALNERMAELMQANMASASSVLDLQALVARLKMDVPAGK